MEFWDRGLEIEVLGAEFWDRKAELGVLGSKRYSGFRLLGSAVEILSDGGSLALDYQSMCLVMGQPFDSE